MKARHFINQLQHDAIIKAIGEAESKIRGHIRVMITRKEPEDAVAAAQKAFLRLKMDRSPERNGVLLYVAPRVRKFAVIGDTAVHAQCGDQFWVDVTQEMSAYFRKGDFTEGILHGVHRATELLAEHFPKTPANG